MPGSTSQTAGLFRVLPGLLEGLGDPDAQGLGHLLPAALGDDHAQLGLEVEGLPARGAVVEVASDQDPALGGELAVEVVVQQMYRFDAVTVVLSHTPSPGAHRQGHAVGQIHTTASAALFFRGGAGSSPSRWGYRGSRRSPCRRSLRRRPAARRCGTARAATPAPL